MFKYVCQNFKDGQVLTADCLNKMEEGIENACQTPGPQGEKGDDGVSVTHEWDGTTLKITSASGTSSADLRGPTGPIGIKGNPGDAGKSAYEYARDSGYMGSEAKFSEQLAGIPDWDNVETYTANATIVISQQSVSGGMWMNRKMDISPGIVYAVYINGKVYFCTAHNHDGGIYLGNITIMDSSATDPHNNEPFCVYWAGGSATGGFFYKDSTLGNSVTLKVTGAEVTTENKLPKKYLPDDVAMKSDIPEGGGGGGSASIDVTASVGQTIVVEEVDADGKPTKWKAAEYQPRTHWTDEGAILEETDVIPNDNGELFFSPLAVPNIGDICKVKYNGAEYVCKAIDGAAMTGGESVLLGNISLAAGTGDTGEPFFFAIVNMEGVVVGQLVPLDDSETFTLSIKGEVVTQIPEKYIPAPSNEVAIHFVGAPEAEAGTENAVSVLESAEYLYDALSNNKSLVGYLNYSYNNQIISCVMHDYTIGRLPEGGVYSVTFGLWQGFFIPDIHKIHLNVAMLDGALIAYVEVSNGENIM